MKKLFVIFILVFALCACQEAIDAINYFLDIEVNKTEGTENTEFVFTANTNDTISEWLIDGQPTSRSGQDLTYNFSAGPHTVSATTTNGATDEVSITVDPVTTRYTISAVQRDETSPLEFDGTTVSGAESVTESDTEYYHTISIFIYVDFEDHFYFINDNAYNLYGIDIQNMTADNLSTLILLFNFDYLEAVYILCGTVRSETDSLELTKNGLIINGEKDLFIDNLSLIDNIYNVSYTIEIDFSDQFLFINDNMQTRFGIDLQEMTYDEFVIMVDIINRYPEEGILDLQEIYSK